MRESDVKSMFGAGLILLDERDKKVKLIEKIHFEKHLVGEIKQSKRGVAHR